MSENETVCYRGVHALAENIRRRELSPVEVTDAYLRRIDALNPDLSAYLTVTADIALEDAKRAETEIGAGKWRGPLHGIPFGVKDIFETAGVRTTHGSSFFRDFVPTRDAEAVRRLRDGSQSSGSNARNTSSSSSPVSARRRCTCSDASPSLIESENDT